MVRIVNPQLVAFEKRFVIEGGFDVERVVESIGESDIGDVYDVKMDELESGGSHGAVWDVSLEDVSFAVEFDSDVVGLKQRAIPRKGGEFKFGQGRELFDSVLSVVDLDFDVLSGGDVRVKLDCGLESVDCSFDEFVERVDASGLSYSVNEPRRESQSRGIVVEMSVGGVDVRLPFFAECAVGEEGDVSRVGMSERVSVIGEGVPIGGVSERVFELYVSELVAEINEELAVLEG